jgi:hypothetical protein
MINVMSLLRGAGSIMCFARVCFNCPLQVFEYEYDLVLQPDINTRGHTQYFYFAVANTRAGQTYRFNIINLQKEDSLYNMGMLPLMHSEHGLHSKVGT